MPAPCGCNGSILADRTGACRIWIKRHRCHEPILAQDSWEGLPLVRRLYQFKEAADVIIANRVTADLADVEAKVFSRDLFGVDA